MEVAEPNILFDKAIVEFCGQGDAALPELFRDAGDWLERNAMGRTWFHDVTVHGFGLDEWGLYIYLDLPKGEFLP